MMLCDEKEEKTTSQKSVRTNQSFRHSVMDAVVSK